jgi:hypothetical protein
MAIAGLFPDTGEDACCPGAAPDLALSLQVRGSPALTPAALAARHAP